MFYHSPLNLLLKRWKAIFVFGLIVGAVSVAVSFLFPLEYRADAQVLIISRSRTGVDPYTVVKSAERVGENVAQVMKTNDFFEKVMVQPGYSLDQSKFAGITERKKRKLWQKTVQTSVVYGTGILNISAYDTDPQVAIDYAGAAADTLSARGWEYVGGDVTIKVVNQPVASKWPARPNLPVNFAAGFVVGLALMSLLTLRKHS